MINEIKINVVAGLVIRKMFRLGKLKKYLCKQAEWNQTSNANSKREQMSQLNNT